MTLKQLTSLCIFFVLRILLRFFYIFPIKKEQILFSSFEGRQFSCNPKYMYNYIKKTFKSQYRYIWVINDISQFNEEVTTVTFLSFRYMYYLLTSKYIISNLGIEPFFPKRKGQIFINTWHGSGAYKSQKLRENIEKNFYTVSLRDYRAKITNCYVSGCEKYSKVMSESWNADCSKFIPCGTPRNDILFSKNIQELRKSILEALKLPDDYGYVLYAPTFRGKSYRNHEEFSINLDIETLVKVCEQRFNKKFYVLYREHVGAKEKEIDMPFLKDVSSYPDIQELMIVSDILITDYSSTIWDYAFLKRPGFLFTPDLNDYIKERGFYTPIESWPFPYFLTNEDLFNGILTFNDIVNNRKIEEHLQQLGSFERGCACAQLVKYMRGF